MGGTSDRTGSPTIDDAVIDLTVPDAKPAAWRTASVDVGHVEWTEKSRRLRRAAPLARAVPKGEKHAYRVGEAATVCGLPLAGLHAWDDRPFGDGLLNRCPDCVGRARS